MRRESKDISVSWIYHFEYDRLLYEYDTLLYEYDRLLYEYDRLRSHALQMTMWKT